MVSAFPARAARSETKNPLSLISIVKGVQSYGSTVCCAQRKVDNRGKPPNSFLNELIDWAREAPDEISVNTHDVYSNVSSELGPFSDVLHRKAVDGMQ